MEGRIIITGFSPWGSHQRNTSWDCLNALPADRCGRLSIERRLIPVAWREAREATRALIDAKPLAVIAFGQCPGDRIRLEAQAHGRHSCSKRDIRGECCADQPGNPDGVYPSALPLLEIAAALGHAGLAHCLSWDAGDYLCNYFFYQLMEARQAAAAQIPAGFIHVPQGQGMADQAISEAMAIAIASTSAWLISATSQPD